MNNNIKAIILDVDGVIIGDRPGFNTPDPNVEVVLALKKLKAAGYIISFCTSKPYFAVEGIVRNANLLNMHIVDGGAVLFDANSNQVSQIVGIPTSDVQALIAQYISQHYYVAMYTPTNFVIQKGNQPEIADKHAQILQRAPIEVDDLVLEATKFEIIKLMLIAPDQQSQQKADQYFQLNFVQKLNIKWGQPAVLKPMQFGSITNKAISKGKMLKRLLEEYGFDRNKILAIGNSDSDWDFMQEADYVATLESGQAGLKSLVRSAGERGYISGGVDENGVIEIFKHFGLL